MKLVDQNGVELDVKKYAMPTKGTEGSASINGEAVATKLTSGRGKDYTYFRIKNVDLYVAGQLGAEAQYTLDLPEGFGSDTEPAPRKSYYIRKRPAKPGEGEIPAGASEVPDGGPQATTDPVTGEAVIAEEVEGDPSAPEEVATDSVEPAEAPKSRKRK